MRLEGPTDEGPAPGGVAEDGCEGSKGDWCEYGGSGLSVKDVLELGDGVNMSRT